MLTEKKDLHKQLWQWTFRFAVIGVLITMVLPFIGEVGYAHKNSATTAGLWLRYFGQFHPVLLHLPIGVVCWVGVAEVTRILSKGRFHFRSTVPLMFGGVTAVLATVFGYFLYLTGEYPTGGLLEEHKRDGILFTVLLLLTLIAQVRLRLAPAKIWSRAYAVCFLLTFLTMLSAGHHGGELTHGEPSDAWPPDVLRKRAAQAEVEDLLVYEEMVKPILEAKCVSCHGPKKAKSGLRVDSVEYMLEGGEETDCLIPSDAENSTLISYLHLPLEDDLRMPPEDKKQLTPREISILEWWVKNGAPQKKKQSEMDTPLALDKF